MKGKSLANLHSLYAMKGGSVSVNVPPGILRSSEEEKQDLNVDIKELSSTCSTSREWYWKAVRKKCFYDLAEAGKAKNTSFKVTEFDKNVEVQLSEDLYGHRTKHVADRFLKVVECRMIESLLLAEESSMGLASHGEKERWACCQSSKEFIWMHEDVIGKIEGNQGSKESQDVMPIQDCCGLWRREAMQCPTLYRLVGSRIKECFKARKG
jgi:hypothetical protein